LIHFYKRQDSSIVADIDKEKSKKNHGKSIRNCV